MTLRRALTVLAAAGLLTVGPALPAQAEGTVGQAFPQGFEVPVDASLGVPVLGFGATGVVRRTPVIFLHGNNDTAYPTSCNGSYGAMQDMAQSFADNGWSTAELWGLSYQGDQCDLLTDQTRRAASAHSTGANVPDLRAFVRAVLRFTGASQVDLVGHSLGAYLSREWMRQDNAYAVVRRLVSVDGPHHGIINCSPSPQNYYAPSLGFTPDSAVCLEYGAADTAFLQQLNAGDETPGPTDYLAIVNSDTSFVYISKQDGTLPPVPAQDREGRPHDFSRSAVLEGAQLLEVTGQGVHDTVLLAAHTGIIASPSVWTAAREFLAPVAAPVVVPVPAPAPAPASPAAPRPPVALPATGADPVLPATAALVLLVLAATTRRGASARQAG